MKITDERGITLIALIITIIVILIISGTTLTLTTSEKSVVKEADKEIGKTEKQNILEKIKADIYVEQVTKNRKLDQNEIKAIISKYATINYESNGTMKSISTEKGEEIPISELDDIL